MIAIIELNKKDLDQLPKETKILQLYDIETIATNDEDYKIYEKYKKKKNKKFYSLEEVKKEIL
jgi:Zn-finger nucleic acid-binding protein